MNSFLIVVEIFLAVLLIKRVYRDVKNFLIYLQKEIREKGVMTLGQNGKKIWTLKKWFLIFKFFEK